MLVRPFDPQKWACFLYDFDYLSLIWNDIVRAFNLWAIFIIEYPSKRIAHMINVYAWSNQWVCVGAGTGYIKFIFIRSLEFREKKSLILVCKSAAMCISWSRSFVRTLAVCSSESRYDCTVFWRFHKTNTTRKKNKNENETKICDVNYF